MKKNLALWTNLLIFFWWVNMSYGLGGLGDIVYDPENWRLNFLTQANTLKSTIQEAEQIGQNAQALAMQAQNLVQTPLTMVAEMQGTISSYTAVLQQAQSIGYELNNVAKQFEDVFTVGGWGAGDMLRKAQMMQQAVRQAGWTGARSQAIFKELCDQLLGMTKALDASHGASGMLSAQQAQTEMLGVIARQQMKLQEVQASTGRVETAFRMMELTKEEQGQISAEHFFGGFGSQGFKGPKEGQGVDLP